MREYFPVTVLLGCKRALVERAPCLYCITRNTSSIARHIRCYRCAPPHRCAARAPRGQTHTSARGRSGPPISNRASTQDMGRSIQDSGDIRQNGYMHSKTTRIHYPGHRKNGPLSPITGRAVREKGQRHLCPFSGRLQLAVRSNHVATVRDLLHSVSNKRSVLFSAQLP